MNQPVSHVGWLHWILVRLSPQPKIRLLPSSPPLLKADCETLNCITDCQRLLCYASGPSIYTRLGLEVCCP
jgi:hypothetical protein